MTRVMDDDLLNDVTLEELLAGRASGRQDLEPLEQFVSVVRSWSDQPAPMPTPELDRLLQGAPHVAPVVPLHGPRPSRRARWRAPIAVVAITAIAGGSFVTAAAAEVLPARLQQQVAELVDRYTPFTVPDGLSVGHADAPVTTTDVATPPTSAPPSAGSPGSTIVSPVAPDTTRASTAVPSEADAPVTDDAGTPSPVEGPATTATAAGSPSPAVTVPTSAVPGTGAGATPVTIPSAVVTTVAEHLALTETGHGRSAARRHTSATTPSTPSVSSVQSVPSVPSVPPVAKERNDRRSGTAHSVPNDVPSSDARSKAAPTVPQHLDETGPGSTPPQTAPPADGPPSDQRDGHRDQIDQRDHADGGQSTGHDPVQRQDTEPTSNASPNPETTPDSHSGSTSGPGGSSGGSSEHGGKR